MSPTWLFICASAVSIFAVLSRQALEDFSFSDAEELLRKRGRTKQDLPRVERFADRLRDHFLTFRFVDVLARAVAAIALWHLVGRSGLEGGWRWFGFLGGFLGHMAVHDLLVRPLASAGAERVTLAMLNIWALLAPVFWLPTLPLRAGYLGMERLLRNRAKDTPIDQAEDEIMAAVSQSEYAGQINEEERDMIESVLGLSNMTVEKVMTPRTDMHAVPLEEGVDGALALAKESGHSRLPVYEENRDNIIGICYVKDLLGLPAGEHPPLRELLRTPLLVPESKKVSELLTELRRDRIHMAVVVDEYGGTAGLITIEDIIEEVFGEIEDEYDEVEEEEAVRNLDDSTIDLDARMHVDEVNERFGVNLPESDRYESLGGLLIAEFGCIPESGQMWETEGMRLTVIDATERRVVRVRLEEAGAESKAG